MAIRTYSSDTLNSEKKLWEVLFRLFFLLPAAQARNSSPTRYKSHDSTVVRVEVLEERSGALL